MRASRRRRIHSPGVTPCPSTYSRSGAALVQLPRRQREVLELVVSFGMTLQESAATLSISPGAASVHYDRGKKRLAAVLVRRTP